MIASYVVMSIVHVLVYVLRYEQVAKKSNDQRAPVANLRCAESG